MVGKKIISSRLEEMTPSVKCLSQCDDPVQSPGTHVRQGAVPIICISSTSVAGWDAEAGKSPEVHKPPSLGCKQQNKRPCLIAEGKNEDLKRSFDLHMCPVALVCPHSHIHKHTHAHTNNNVISTALWSIVSLTLRCVNT